MCERFDIDYRMIQSVGIGSVSAAHMINIDQDDTKKAKEILDHEYFDLINYPKFVGWPVMQNLGGFTMIDIIEPNNFPNYHPTDLYLNKVENEDGTIGMCDRHPNQEGHKIISDIILNTL